MEKNLRFSGTRNYLSNFYQCKAVYYDRTFLSSEAAYQWTKAIITGQYDAAIKLEYTNSGPVAKQIGKTLAHINQHYFWINGKKEVLKYIVVQKFTQNPHLMEALNSTKDMTLLENTQDEYWGVGKNEDGKNEMGKILMDIRGKDTDNIKNELRQLERRTHEIIAIGQTLYSNPYRKLIKITNQDLIQQMKDNDHRTLSQIQYTIIGDSIVRDLPTGKATRTISIGGAKIAHLTKYIIDNPIQTHTDAVVIQAGTNHVEDTSVPLECIKHQYQHLILTVRKQLPTTPIILVALLPRPKDQKFNATETNYLTERRKIIITMQRQVCTTPGTYYRNCNKIFTKDKKYREGIFRPDGLHLTERGKEMYAIGINRVIHADLQHTIMHLKQRRKIVNT